MFGVPRNTLPINGNVHTDILLLGIIALEHVHSKQFSVGLMVFSDGLMYVLKIEGGKKCQIRQNLSCGFKRTNYAKFCKNYLSWISIVRLVYLSIKVEQRNIFMKSQIL